MLLGVNIDHVATLRQARGTNYPDILEAARIAELSGADAITIHLREDRRHIQDADVEALRNSLATRMNLEMAVTEEMISIAQRIVPQDCCLVPEKRQELTTEGGLDVIANFSKIENACKKLGDAGIRVSLFIDPVKEQIHAAAKAGAPVIEIHTGCYSDAVSNMQRSEECDRVEEAVNSGLQVGLQVNAGHGLHFKNVEEIAGIKGISELNIGHSIIAEAVFCGLAGAVTKMKSLMLQASARE